MVESWNENDKTQSFVPVAPGTVVGRYKIVKKIGAGGMGEVFSARDNDLDRTVALKFMPQMYLPDGEAQARFRREAQAAARLKHPNIVTIYEVGEFEGRPFFAMELVEGQSLDKVIKKNELGFETIINWVIQIAEGLGNAHHAEVIHRDIKPSNIVIDPDGRPKILDFGLAMVKGGEKLTKTGSTIGTIRYMSPEQVDARDIDFRSDLYSLGVVMYEMIAGRVPFTGDNNVAIIQAILNNTPEPLARYKADVPEEMQGIINKLLQKDAEVRYQSAAGVVADLKRLSRAATTEIRKEKSRKTGTWVALGFAGVLSAVVACLFILYLPARRVSHLAPTRMMLAVLPFENLGLSQDEYFADGITDEIITKLASIRDLGVISRTSAMRYKKSERNPGDIGKELKVDYVIIGTVRWDKSGDTDRVRISPQLIRIADEVLLWANNYERALTQIFAIQTDIAENIANALDVTVLESTRKSIEKRLTVDPDAYTYYLRGLHYSNRSYSREDMLLSVEMYQKAIELDADFALAHAVLSERYSWIYWTCESTAEYLTMAREAADRALELDPDLPEAHLALAKYYYHGKRDYERALVEIELAAEQGLQSSWLHSLFGAVKRRQGKWEEAIVHIERCVELDPWWSVPLFELGMTNLRLRRYAEAETCYDRASSLAPDISSPYTLKSNLYLVWEGSVAKARAVLHEASRLVDTTQLTYCLARCDVFDRDFENAINKLPSMLVDNDHDEADYYLTKGEIYYLMGQTEASMACYDSARIILKDKVDKKTVWEGVERSRLGFSYAGLGQEEAAIREGELAIGLLPVFRDHFVGPELVWNLARIYTMVDKSDSAIDWLEYLLSIPSEYSAHLLRLDPIFDPLRDNPRFQKLLGKSG